MPVHSAMSFVHAISKYITDLLAAQINLIVEPKISQLLTSTEADRIFDSISMRYLLSLVLLLESLFFI